jgi:hypothetical protein
MTNFPFKVSLRRYVRYTAGTLVTHPNTHLLQRPEEQSRTGSCQGSSVAGQPQCPRLWHRSTPNARSLSHSPSAPPPSFTQSPYPPRSLVRDEQTHPHRPRLVVSHSTCPPLSSSPHANSFVIGPAVIKHTHPWVDFQTWVLRATLVVSRSTCPPISNGGNPLETGAGAVS